MKFVSLIPARGGSKEVPLKNIKPLNGHPLIHYTIRASLNSRVTDTFVSTDCEKIKKAAAESGATIIDRPPSLATDESPSEEALLHFAQSLDFDYLVFIQATSPLLESRHIDEGIDLITDGKADSVFSATLGHWIPTWSQDLTPLNWDTKDRPRRQDKEPYYTENGAFYITSRASLLESGLRYSGKLKIVEMPLSKSFQIDTLDDFNLVEKLL